MVEGMIATSEKVRREALRAYRIECEADLDRLASLDTRDEATYAIDQRLFELPVQSEDGGIGRSYAAQAGCDICCSWGCKRWNSGMSQKP
jgi:hypothetical protein